MDIGEEEELIIMVNGGHGHHQGSPPDLALSFSLQTSVLLYAQMETMNAQLVLIIVVISKASVFAPRKR